MKILQALIQKIYKTKSTKTVEKSPQSWYNISIENKKNKGVVNLKNLQKVLADYKAKSFTIVNDKIKQTERNEFKASISAAIAADLADAGLQVGKVDKGYAFLVENDQLGAIAVSVDAVVKNDLNYDFDFEVAEQARKEAEIAERKAKRKAKAQG